MYSASFSSIINTRKKEENCNTRVGKRGKNHCISQLITTSNPPPPLTHFPKQLQPLHILSSHWSIKIIRWGGEEQFLEHFRALQLHGQTAKLPSVSTLRRYCSEAKWIRINTYKREWRNWSARIRDLSPFLALY